MPFVTQKYYLTTAVKLNSKYGSIICPTKGKDMNYISNNFFTFKVKNKYIDKKSIIALSTNLLTIDNAITTIPQISIGSIGNNKFYITFFIEEYQVIGANNIIDNNLIIYFNIL